MIEVCVPVLNRHDLLERLLESLELSVVKPTRLMVVDNGQRWAWRPKELSIPVDVFTPAVSMGVAESWNWFLDQTAGDILLCNDDIIFAPESFGSMIKQPAPFVSCGYGFSCFVLRRELVAQIGRFDEQISPGYAYYEDRDYYNRMQAAGVKDIVVDCGVQHLHSQTVAGFTPQQLSEHHKKFRVAEKNFLAKWGESSWSPSLSRP